MKVYFGQIKSCVPKHFIVHLHTYSTNTHTTEKRKKKEMAEGQLNAL